jgi:hypothetical protein
MAKYGSINNVGELKIHQNSNPNEVFIGINKNGFAYVFDGREAKKLTKEQLTAALQFTPEQIDKILKTRGTARFDFSKENSVEEKAVRPARESGKVEKLLKKQNHSLMSFRN